jgi:hypothetical protein
MLIYGVLPKKQRIKMDKINLEGIKSKEWGVFKMFPYNRTIDLNRVNKISEVIRKNGFRVPITVILINGYYYIIDGQHRFEACKKNDIPVIALVLRDVKEENIPELIADYNSVSKSWTGKDYYNMWVFLKKVGYIEMENIRTKYDITYTILSNLMAGVSIYNGSVSRNMKNPEFRLKKEVESDIITKLEYMNDILRIDTNWESQKNNICLKTAIIRTILKYGYSQKRMIEICSHLIPIPNKTLKDYCNWLEFSYNYKIKNPENRLRNFKKTSNDLD